ncbi:MAG: FixH family protein [Kistimonas sp.]|nr:FixH family protein [Kistimonas sp.]
MMNSSSHKGRRFWYREPWAWFLVAMVLISVAWGLFLVVVSLRYADKPVVDDYYKTGKAINMDPVRSRQARELNISARVLLTSETGPLQVTLAGEAHWPQQLLLHAVPKSVQLKEATLVLQRLSDSASSYSSQGQSLPPGQYFLQLNTLDAMVPEQGYVSGWRLTGNARMAPGVPLTLSAR